LRTQAIVAIRNCRISLAIVCKSRRGYQTHLTASEGIGGFQLVVSKSQLCVPNPTGSLGWRRGCSTGTTAMARASARARGREVDGGARRRVPNDRRQQVGPGNGCVPVDLIHWNPVNQIRHWRFVAVGQARDREIFGQPAERLRLRPSCLLPPRRRSQKSA
jgi:hypothetical protein